MRPTSYTSHCAHCKEHTKTGYENKEEYIELSCLSCGNPKKRVTHEKALERLSLALTDEEEEDDLEDNVSMLFLNGRSNPSFRCAGCGANCFRRFKSQSNRYKCNGCEETYTAVE